MQHGFSHTDNETPGYYESLILMLPCRLVGLMLTISSQFKKVFISKHECMPGNALVAVEWAGFHAFYGK